MLEKYLFERSSCSTKTMPLTHPDTQFRVFIIRQSSKLSTFAI